MKAERQAREKAEAERDKLQARVDAMRECVEVLEDWEHQIVNGLIKSSWTTKRIEALAKLKECEG